MSKNYGVTVLLQGKKRIVSITDTIPAENKKEAERSFLNRFSNHKVRLVMASLV